MRLFCLVLLALPALSATPAAAVQEAPIVVRGDASRVEIERILEADNVDTSLLEPRDVARAIGAIGRGRAPEDFWIAYRAHVEAWERLAAAVEARQRSPHPGFEAAEQLLQAAEAVETSFDEVERIARRYGARLPIPAWKRATAI